MKTALFAAALLLGGAIVTEVDAKPRATKRAKAKAKRRAKPPVAPPPVAPAPEPQPAPEPAVVEAPAVEAAPVDAAEPAVEAAVEHPAARGPFIELSVDDGPMIRRLRYTDDWARDGETVRDYDLVANAIGVRLAVRPLRAFPVELYTIGEMIAGVSGSRGPDGEVYATRSMELQVGVRAGGTLHGVRAGLELAGGQHAFSIDDAMSARGELVPDTRYRYARMGGTATMPLTERLALSATAGFRMLTSSGALAGAAWFPWATGNGIDGSLGVAFALTSSIDAYARAHVRRYYFAMNSEPGDALVVGGAIDQYVAAVLGLRLSVR